MPHSSHKIVTYRDVENVWVTFCEWCGFDDERLEQECNRRYHPDYVIKSLPGFGMMYSEKEDKMVKTDDIEVDKPKEQD